jgi:oligoribonuclease
MAATGGETRLIWIDLEMTGLDTTRDSILEIATVVTDADLEVLAEGPELAIAHRVEALETMDDWNRNQHARSGLWRRALEEGVPMAEAWRSCANGSRPMPRRCAATRSARTGASCIG